MRRLAVVLLSGGLDSTTVAAEAVASGAEVRALCVAYGQRHAREVDAARAVAAALGIPLQVAQAAFYRELASWSALTDPAHHALPLARAMDALGDDVPITYVPLRNTFFVTLAAALLESWALALIEVEGVDAGSLDVAVHVGANAIDYSGYPDCRPEFYRSLEAVLAQGSKLGSWYRVPLRIEAPLLAASKADIVRRGVAAAAPLQLTWSCYEGGDAPCGGCDSCLLRAEGFRAAGYPDPALAGGSG